MAGDKPEITKDEYIEQLHAQRQELVKALEANNDLLFGLLDYFERGHELSQINAQREKNIELLAAGRKP